MSALFSPSNDADEHRESLVVRLAQDLIRFNTTNYGGGKSEGEAEAAAYVSDFLRDCGLDPVVIESAPTRASVVARWPGKDPSLPALVLHGHLDVVPAEASEWSVDPFGGVIADGCLWGRGAVDMKNMDAVILATVKQMTDAGTLPRRDIVLAFFADEEAGGVYGARYLVDHHPELFAGATEAISEVGGYSVQMGDERAYLVQTGEKGLIWADLTAHGQAGHGSQINPENAITKLAGAVAAIGLEQWPIELTDTTRTLLDEVRKLRKLPEESDPRTIGQATGFAARFVSASLQNTANPTVVQGGYKHNVIPANATASLDIRPLPGQHQHVLERLQQIIGPDIEISISHQDVGLEVPFEGEIVDAMTKALRKHDPEATLLPYLLSAGTDNKALSRLGITGFGFVPLKLPADFDFPAMFHGVDERIPISSLVFCQRVVYDLISSY